MKRVIHWLLDILFPKYCLGCNKENSYLCKDCFAAIPILQNAHCFLCGLRSPTGHVCKKCKNKFHPALSGLLIASNWNNLLLRQIIYKYKYSFIKELSQPLSQIIIKFLLNLNFILLNSQFIIIPVPLHKRRLQWRGFNQAELLAQEISGFLGIPINNQILERARYTLPQAEIKSKQERYQNIKNVFKVNEKINSTSLNNPLNIKSKIIILIDDICTTTSTLEECAKTLKPLGPKEIWALAIARG
ncbi:hypothetical protein KJ853_02840 [Patescibacteria group bacterium]|nr:hypothetical protein [Patescibacteria group bacterium]